MDKEELYIDIDNFKTINNNFGFQFGNLVIKEFARLLSSLLGESCELAKFPGDKFMIILYGFKDMKEVEELCDKIYDFFEKPMEILDNQIYINLSAGVAFFPHDSSDVNELIKFCDFAVSQSKALGKNVCTLFDKQVEKSYHRRSLIESGFKIAIDDFGTGYSNLISLIEFPISTLKIDKSIVDNIECEKNKVVFKSIVTLSKDLKFQTIAEGVETKKQLDILSKLGCDGIQGYYFYKPLPKEEIEGWLEKGKCDK